MDRRGFLGRLLGGLAVAATAPALDLFTPDAAAADVVTSTYENAFRDLVRDALKEFQRQLPFPIYRLVVEGEIGAVGLTHQHVVQVDDAAMGAATREELMERYIAPAMARLAHSARRSSVFGVLPLPFGTIEGAVATSTDAGVSLRGIRGYDVGWDMATLRFDVVCG